MWQYANESPYLFFLIVVVVLPTIIHYLFKCYNRLLRHLNILWHGWPPHHLDADGDFNRE